MLSHLICELLQGLFLRASRSFACVFYGLEIAVALVVAIVAMISLPGEGGGLLVLAALVYAGFCYWQLKSTLRNFHARNVGTSRVQQRTIPEPQRKNFDELAAELKREVDMVEYRLVKSHKRA
jgi:hypothetical protein